ncbi:MAG: hypothetical protein MOGMAGMI_00128 [Candidatus Omnitrophica bacterium]|nr:hypothetical protein [Candidatus Omnitrophota bacterium]
MSETDSQQNAVNPASHVKTWESAVLFEGGRMVQISHEGHLYRLLITRQGKLILNK